MQQETGVGTGNNSAFLLLTTVLQPRMMYKQSVIENKQFNRKTITLTACSVCQVQICFPSRKCWLLHTLGGSAVACTARHSYNRHIG